MGTLTFEVKEFIEDNIDLIEENRWDEVYDNAAFNLDSDSTGIFTKAMLDIGLNPITEQGLDWIPDYYLSGTSITKFTIPNTIHSVGEGCFSYSSLEKITIPESVKTLRDYVFYGCGQLKEIIFLGDITDIGSRVIYGCSEDLKIICKKGSHISEYYIGMKMEYID